MFCFLCSFLCFVSLNALQMLDGRDSMYMPVQRQDPVRKWLSLVVVYQICFFIIALTKISVSRLNCFTEGHVRTSLNWLNCIGDDNFERQYAELYLPTFTSLVSSVWLCNWRSYNIFIVYFNRS